jgi:Cu2+-exporting ATPase
MAINLNLQTFNMDPCLAPLPQALADTAVSDMEFTVDGMTCGLCAFELERLLLKSPWVASVQVNPVSQLAAVQVKHSVPVALDSASAYLNHFAELLARTPYRLLAFDPVHGAKNSARSVRQALLRFLVALLIWMQIMMYSAPEYFYTLEELTPQTVVLLRWAQWMLSLPLMLYCAQPVFSAAWRALCLRRASMDQPVALALVSAFMVSSQATFSGEGVVWFDSLSMFLTLLLAARYLTQRLRHQALACVGAVSSDLPDTVLLKVGQSFQSVLRAQLKIHDECKVLVQQVVPADGFLLSEEAWVSEAMLSGESTALQKHLGDFIRAGSRVQSPALLLKVTATGAQSSMGRIGQSVATAMQHKPAIAALAQRWSLWVLLLLAALSVGSGAFWEWQAPGRGWSVFIAVLMVSCPCAIALAAPVAQWVAGISLIKKGAVLINPQALELLPEMTDVVFDKTGTLTQSEGLTQLHWFNESLQVFDASDFVEFQSFLAGMAFHSEHPVARALAQHFQRLKLPLVKSFLQPGAGSAQNISELTERVGQGLEARFKDGVARVGSAEFCSASVQQQTDHDAQLWVSYQPAGKLPVCLAVGEVHCGIRQGYRDLLESLCKAHMKLHLWSGDQTRRVSALAEQLQIADWKAKQSSEDKLSAVTRLQQSGCKVMMVGDGLNDAPIMAQAHVSVAMVGASQVAAQQADILLLNGDLNTLRLTIELAKKLRRVVSQNLAWSLLYNLAAVPLACFGLMPPLWAGVGMALSSLLVLGNALRLKNGV